MLKINNMLSNNIYYLQNNFFRDTKHLISDEIPLDSKTLNELLLDPYFTSNFNSKVYLIKFKTSSHQLFEPILPKIESLFTALTYYHNRSDQIFTLDTIYHFFIISYFFKLDHKYKNSFLLINKDLHSYFHGLPKIINLNRSLKFWSLKECVKYYYVIADRPNPEDIFQSELFII